MNNYTPPSSPYDEVSDYVYFARLCSKIRLQQSGKLDPEFHPNMGKGMDLWTCQLLHIDYDALRQLVIDGATDEQALEWCWKNGTRPNEHELEWWNSFMRNRCFRDDLSELLVRRKKESGWQDRDEIQTMFDYLDADDGRL
ncbi:MAG: DUF5069 domain-containing protein [Akkermansiaceae bacterium]|jgi:hypothetical protein|tara:strand:- start:5249 stop:5671 length:423 start_codon:yes stop_codon:yes gene_type:complete